VLANCMFRVIPQGMSAWACPVPDREMAAQDMPVGTADSSSSRAPEACPMCAQQPRDISIRILVKGYVQGVGFRQSARKYAEELGLPVSATNQADGSVLIETTGPRETVQKMIDWTYSGPPRAQVDDVTVINCNRYSRTDQP